MTRLGAEGKGKLAKDDENAELLDDVLYCHRDNSSKGLLEETGEGDSRSSVVSPPFPRLLLLLMLLLLSQLPVTGAATVTQLGVDLISLASAQMIIN